MERTMTSSAFGSSSRNLSCRPFDQEAHNPARQTHVDTKPIPRIATMGIPSHQAEERNHSAKQDAKR